MTRNWLRTQADDESAPDWHLDHGPEWGGFADAKFNGSVVAQEQAAEAATRATGKEFGLPMDDLEFQETVVEGEAYQDMEGEWLR